MGEAIWLFLSIFCVVMVNEISGDKTLIATASASLQNPKRRLIVFLGSAGALSSVSGITTFTVGFIPPGWIPWGKLAGSALLLGYGLWIGIQTWRNGQDEEEESLGAGAGLLGLLSVVFSTVFLNEITMDKTMAVTGTAALANMRLRLVVFFASASSLTTCSAVATWGVGLIPQQHVPKVKLVGAALLVLYGLYLGGFVALPELFH